jgi:hypothetical protein
MKPHRAVETYTTTQTAIPATISKLRTSGKEPVASHSVKSAPILPQGVAGSKSICQLLLWWDLLECHFPPGAGWLTHNYRPCSPQRRDPQSSAQCYRKRLETLCIIAVKADGWFRIRMTLSTLARFKGFNSSRVENFDRYSYFWIERGIVTGVVLLSLARLIQGTLRGTV